MKIKYNERLFNCDVDEISRLFENKNSLNYVIYKHMNMYITRIRNRIEHFRNQFEQKFSEHSINEFNKSFTEYSNFKSLNKITLVEHLTRNTFTVNLNDIDHLFKWSCHIKKQFPEVFYKELGFYPSDIFDNSSFIILAIIDNKYAYVKYRYDIEQKLNFFNQIAPLDNPDFEFIGYENIIPLEHIYFEEYIEKDFLETYKKELIEEHKQKQAFGTSLSKQLEEEQRTHYEKYKEKYVHLSTPTSSVANPFVEFARTLQQHSNFAEEFRQHYMLNTIAQQEIDESVATNTRDRIRDRIRESYDTEIRNRVEYQRTNRINGLRADTVVLDDIEF